MTFKVGEQHSGAPRFVIHRLGPQRVQALRAFAAKRNATLNDLAVAGMLRGLARFSDWQGDSALRLAGTVDLRRYLPGGRGAALCNLSSFMFQPNLGYELGEDFADTLDAVKAQIDPIKADMIGLPFMLVAYLLMGALPFAWRRSMVRRMFGRMISSGNMPPTMTNMGRVDHELLGLDGPIVIAAHLLCPPAVPPAFACGLSGFRDTLCFSAGIFESAVSAENLARLFQLVDQELPGD